jgi:hypothetical protein
VAPAGWAATRAPGPRWAVLRVLACLYVMNPLLRTYDGPGFTDALHVIASGSYLYGLLLVAGALVPIRLYKRRARALPSPTPAPGADEERAPPGLGAALER